MMYFADFVIEKMEESIAGVGGIHVRGEGVRGLNDGVKKGKEGLDIASVRADESGVVL